MIEIERLKNVMTEDELNAATKHAASFGLTLDEYIKRISS